MSTQERRPQSLKPRAWQEGEKREAGAQRGKGTGLSRAVRGAGANASPGLGRRSSLPGCVTPVLQLGRPRPGKEQTQERPLCPHSCPLIRGDHSRTAPLRMGPPPGTRGWPHFLRDDPLPRHPRRRTQRGTHSPDPEAEGLADHWLLTEEETPRPRAGKGGRGAERTLQQLHTALPARLLQPWHRLSNPVRTAGAGRDGGHVRLSEVS